MAAVSNTKASTQKTGRNETAASKPARTQTSGEEQRTSRPNGYTETYTGGNAELDKALKNYSDQYFAAREAGDARGMRDANDAANQARNQYGYRAEYASEDIAKVAAQASKQSSSGGSGRYGGPSGEDIGSYHTDGYYIDSGRDQNVTPFERVELTRPTDYSSYIEEMNRAKQAAALNELKSAYDKNVAVLNHSRDQVAPAYQQARNQIAGTSEQAKRQFAEYAAAHGLSSGTGGQAELSRQNALQSSLGQLNREEASKLADLEFQRGQLETDYNSAIAKAKADGDFQLASQLYQEKVRVDEALRQMQLQQADLDFKTWQANYTMQRDQTADERYARQLQLQQAQWQLEREQWDKNWNLDQEKWAAEQEHWDKNWQRDQDRWEQQWAADQDHWNKNWQQSQEKWALEQDRWDKEQEHWDKSWEREGEQWTADQQWKRLELLTEQQKQQDALKQQAYENQMEAAQYYAKFGDLSGFQAMGKDTTQMQTWLDEQKALQQAKKTGKTTSSRSSSSKSTKSSNNKSTSDKSSKGRGGDKTNLPSFSSYSQAAAYLKQKGISAGGLMTQTEWTRHRNNKSDTSGASAYPNYQSYLNAFIRYMLR
ncbi:MAG: hypothetical protein HFE97_10900 [Oscillospiraceae bacterium]|nr:hypothetical protein [Oscillospiraceae bacterium]